MKDKHWAGLLLQQNGSPQLSLSLMAMLSVSLKL